MCEAGSPLAFYKHGGGVEFGTTKQKKKICSNYCTERDLNTTAPDCIMQLHRRLSHAVAVSFWLLYSLLIRNAKIISHRRGRREKKKERLVLYKVNIPEEHAKHSLDSADKLKVFIKRTAPWT